MNEQYLQASEIIDWQNPEVLQLAHKLATGKSEVAAIAKACFEWVRDEIHHSCDYQLNPVTCCASDVLKYGTGYCYAKSHLLAALLRANYIPTGFCYQRLSLYEDGAPYCLHGLNAVFLPEIGWYRIDARGNKDNVNAQFTPPQEQLAFPLIFAEEFDCKTVFAAPLPIIVSALQAYSTWDALLNNLPDLQLAELEKLNQ